MFTTEIYVANISIIRYLMSYTLSIYKHEEYIGAYFFPLRASSTLSAILFTHKPHTMCHEHARLSVTHPTVIFTRVLIMDYLPPLSTQALNHAHLELI